MRSLRVSFWAWLAGAVFYAFPLIVILFGPYRGTVSTAQVLATTAAALATGVPGLILLVIVFVRDNRRQSTPVTIAVLDRDHRLAVAGLGLFAATMTIMLVNVSWLLAGVYAALVIAYATYCMLPAARRLEYRSAVSVGGSSEMGFALVRDPRNWHRYLPVIDVTEPVDPPVRVGTVIHVRVVDRRLTVLADEVVTVYEPPTRFGTSVARREQEGVYEFATGGAGTEIAYSFRGVLTVPQSLLGGPMRRGAMVRRMKSRRDEAMLRIKEILETEPAVTV